jgi:basic membrane lipoprotein Med (substrate-binding protein (PBP1-ABC) superfamily)/DNA-binding SARP family transcriptional activator/Tol biopolymer transport system component
MRRQRGTDTDRRTTPADSKAGAYHGIVRFEVLGSMRVVAAAHSGGRIAATTELSLGGPKQRFVLARLVAEPNRVVSVDRLVDGLWGDDPPETARHTVQAYISELRKTLGSLVERDNAGYRIRVSGDTLDTLDFEARVAEARTRAPLDPSGAVTEFEAALGLWRGPAFDDFSDQPFLQVEAARLEELRLAVVEELMQARLSTGQHAAVIVELERLTRDHPYREELRALHMVALYRSGRQADALRAYQATREVLGEELGILPSPRLRRLEEQILLQDPDLDPASGRAERGPPTNRWLDNPYLGLRPFREADYARFFGQDQLVERLVARVLGATRFTALVGPSGSGKSSAVQAGLVPHLRRDHPEVLIAQMQPGSQPHVVLEAALGQLPGVDHWSVAQLLASGTGGLLACVSAVLGDGSSRLLLVVDQFEELFTMVDPAEASRFLALLANAADDRDGRVHVLVTLRADFYDRPLADPHLGQLFADNVVSVVALGPDQLEAAATLPARQLDIAVEPRLVARLVADVAGQPNALPLFQYAMTEVFDGRDGPVLDLATYERIGGVRKAVARRAESLYGQLDPAEQDAARQLFLRIVTVSGDIVGRRRAPASELVSLDIDVIALRSAIDVFARYRLLALDRDPATGSPTVEVAHDALLAEWHRLRDWIEQCRDDLAKQASFVSAVNEWEAARRDPGYLLTGTRLDDYERWVTTTSLRFTATEHDFIAISIAARETEVADGLQREHAQSRLRRRSNRQLLLLVAVIGVLAAVISYPLLTTRPTRDTIAVALSGRRADDTFDELVARGVESAAAEFGLDAVVLEPPYTDLDGELRRLADSGPKLIFGAVALHKQMLAIAGDYPNTTFALIDSNAAYPTANVVAVNFAVEQGSFLVGAAAALESATGKIGYIGANSQPFIEAFRAGFEQGAIAADPDAEIVPELIFPRRRSGLDSELGYADPERAREIATALFEDGVDVIFVAAGESYRGVVEAATELSGSGRQLWVIGVDSDTQYDITDVQRNHLLTSMFKRVERGVEAVVSARGDGSVALPGALTVTLADGGVGYTNAGGHLRPTTVDALETFRAGIIDGTIKVDPIPADEPPTVELPFFLDLRTRAMTPLAKNLTGGSGEYAVTADGTRLAYGTCVCNGGDVMTVANVDGTDAHILEPPAGVNDYAAQWSPDGTKLVFQERNGADPHTFGNLFVQDRSTGHKTQITELEATTSNGWWWIESSFNPDGRNVIFHLPRGSPETPNWDVWSVPVTGGAPTLVLADAAYPAYFPDGTHILFVSEMTSHFAGGSISIADAHGSRRTLVRATKEIWLPTISPDGSSVAYLDGGAIYVVDVATGESSKVAFGWSVAWLDNHTLIVVPDR